MNLEEIFDIAYKMSAVSRYSQTHIINRESVLEHTGFVCLSAYMIAGKLLETGEDINIGEVMCRAVAHDVDEIITGDIPRPTKYYNEGVLGIMRKIEDENMIKISKSLNMHMIYEHWKNAKIGDKEGIIISLCDTLAVIYKTYYEVIMFGNKTIIDHTVGLYHHLDKLDNLSKHYFKFPGQLHSIIKDAKILCTKIQTQTGDST